MWKAIREFFTSVSGDTSNVVDLRSNQERALERKARSSLRGKDEEIAHRLLTLTQQANDVYYTDKEAYNRMFSEIKSIGEDLCSNGGDKRMKRVAYRVSALGGSARELEMYWNGVCGWAV